MITVIFTCFNRREKTLQCIKSLSGGNKDIAFQYVIVDDNSTDGTYEALEDLKRSGMTIDVLRGTGNLFWAGGMRKGIAYAKGYSSAVSDVYKRQQKKIQIQTTIFWSMMMLTLCRRQSVK